MAVHSDVDSNAVRRGVENVRRFVLPSGSVFARLSVCLSVGLSV